MNRLVMNPEAEMHMQRQAPRVSLVLVGYPGIGKSTLARDLADLTNRPIVEMGDAVRSAAARQDPPLAPMEYADQTFRHGSPTFFVEQIVDRIDQVEPPLIVVGPRRPEEIVALSALIAPSLSIGLVADQEVRRRRQRRRLDGAYHPDLLDEWAVRDEVERSWGLDDALAEADVLLSASADRHEVVAAVIELWMRAGAAS